MANVLKAEMQERVIAALCEGASIRSIERQRGVHRDRIMRLGVRVGEGCAQIIDERMRNLGSRFLELDEIWGFIGKKQKHVRTSDSPEVGDVWTFVALDAETKIVPTFRVGKRTAPMACAFLKDLSSRLRNRVQISTDELASYVGAVEEGFGGEVDYGQIVKSYSVEDGRYPEGKYSPPEEVVQVTRTIVTGTPDPTKISTSYVERNNLTMRMHVRRLTRLTNGFSKRLANFKAAIGLHFGYYNFVKRHATLRMTPAMAAGVAKDFWTVRDLVKMTA